MDKTMSDKITVIKQKYAGVRTVLALLTAIGALGTFAVTFMTGVNEFPEFRQNASNWSFARPFLGAPISLKINANYSIDAFSPIEVIIDIRDEGYYTLWNLSSTGEVHRLLPEPQDTKLAESNRDNYLGYYKVMGNKKQAQETLILLWTKNDPDHPSQIDYENYSKFERYLKDNKSFNFEKATASIQIR